MEYLASSSFTSFVNDLLKRNNVPGLSIAAVHNDEVFSTGYGIANYEDNIPCTSDTLFDIASSSKSLTAASVALLVDDKKYPKLQYNALMSDLLPDDFVMLDKTYTDGITVEDVLSHRTGMANHDSSHRGPKASHPDTAKSVTRNLRNLKVAAPLRSRYLYCNQMYTVATHLVEETSRQSFSDFLEQRIFIPLDMTSTTSQPAGARSRGWADRMAKGYIWENQSWRGFDPQDCPEGQGAGSVISSVNDFIKWVKALLYHEGPVNDRVYQGLTTMRSIVNPQARRLRAHTTPAIYAAGKEIYYYRGCKVIGHDGCVPGFASRFIFMPELKFGAVVLGNSAGAGPAATVIIRALMDEILAVPVEDRPSYQQKPAKKDKPERPLAIHPGTHSKVADKHLRHSKEQPSHASQTMPEIIPLESYVGKYWNAGYHSMTVQIQDNHLFVDALDRSMGFTLTFHHVRNQTEYIAALKDEIELTAEPIHAEFVFDDGKVVKMGLDLEPAIKELICFDLVDSGASCI
ncbi:beta-lactamase/transpeptidase-like protein [Aspergillus aurantiobrunneus]